jgi:hypothetical protein
MVFFIHAVKPLRWLSESPYALWTSAQIGGFHHQNADALDFLSG